MQIFRTGDLLVNRSHSCYWCHSRQITAYEYVHRIIDFESERTTIQNLVIKIANRLDLRLTETPLNHRDTAFILTSEWT
jgi:hypothetical protein